MEPELKKKLQNETKDGTKKELKTAAQITKVPGSIQIYSSIQIFH
jgi:hypothetical protein